VFRHPLPSPWSARPDRTGCLAVRGRSPRGRAGALAARVCRGHLDRSGQLLPPDTGNYVVSVAVSPTPECGPGCELSRIASPLTRWFYEPVTLEIALP
jgi:hypothetical protein